MTESRIADNVWWHVNKEARQQEKIKKPKSRIDAKFEEWAARNKVDLKSMKLMEKPKK
jgi:hypothetical protein